MNINVDMRGFAALNARLEKLSKEEATKAGAAANRAGAAVARKAIKAAAPIGPTAEGAKITRNNKTGTRDETHYKISNNVKVKKVRSTNQTEVVHSVYVSAKAYQAAFVEFGSIHNAPNPFMQNAFEDSEQQIVDAMKRMLERQLIKRGA